MKTKKRLQALIAVVAMLSMICGSLPAVYAADTSTSEEEVALPGPFQASKAYVANSDGNPVGPWQWNYYDKTKAKYEKLPHFISGGRGFSIVNNYNNCTAVNQNMMYADMRANEVGGATEDAWTRYYPVRTFTAPNSGNITISAGDSLTGGGSRSGPNVRIMLEHSGKFSQVWPSEGWQVVKSNAPVNFEPLTRNITAGDKLHFELSGEHLAQDAIKTGFIRVNWDPIVTYNSLSYVMPEYQASAEYQYTAPGASPRTKNWVWQYYDAKAGNYKDLTTVAGVGKFAVAETGNYPIPKDDDDTGDTFIRTNDGNVARVGKYWMAPDFYAKSGDNPPTNYCAVRTFIVRESGNVTITAENGVPEYSGAIRGATNRTTENTVVRLIKTDMNNTYKTQLWPTVNDPNLATINGYDGTFAIVQGSSSTQFPPLTVNVKKGERLRFEVGTRSDINWVNIGVYWDPKITYNSYMELDSFLPEDTDRVTLDQTFALTAKNAMSGTVTAEDISITGGSGNASVKAATMSNENKTISFSFDGLEFGKSYTVTIKDPTDTAVVLYRFTFTTLNLLYTSSAGTEDGAGTTASPLSFQKALEQAKDGEKIIVMDEIVLPADFAWPTEKKHVTVSGEGYPNAALNTRLLPSSVLNVNTDTTFESLVFASTEEGNADKVGRINAMGNVVTLAESVSTRGIFGSFYGGGKNNWDSVDKTETYIYGGNFHRIFGGGGHVLGDCKLTVGGNTNTNGYGDPSDERNNLFAPIIYGGTYDNTVEGDCITTITGNAAARSLYGGSLDVKDNADRGAGVKGKIVVNVQGGKFMDAYGMNPTSTSNAGGTVSDTSEVVINMTGGTVESLIGSSANTNAASINASITINAMGGTVTRRIIGGVYNDLQKSGSRNSMVGTVAVRIGGGMKGLTDTQIGNGIIAGSRAETKPADETATLIFLDDTYEKYRKNITHNNGGSFSGGIGADWCDSNYDYLVTGTAGGDIVPAGSNQITVTPDEGYEAYIGGESVQENYTLSSVRTDVVFTNDGPPPLIPAISDLSGTVAESGVQAMISYTAAADTNTLILALYDNNSLVAVVQPSVTQGIHANQAITIPYVQKTGETYTLKAFLWDGMENILPLCEAKSVDITAQ